MRAPRERRKLLIVTAYAAIAASFIQDAAFGAMVIPIQDDLNLSLDSVQSLMTYPEMAGFAVIFIAGALAVRLGRRTIIVAASIVFAAGAVLTSLAANLPVLAMARVLVGIGAIALTVVGLSIINLLFEGPQRGRAFGVAAAIGPAFAIVMPNLSAAMCERFGWRSVSLLWIIVAVALVALTLACVPARTVSEERSDLVTPVVGGLAVGALSFSATTLSAPGLLTAYISIVVQFRYDFGVMSAAAVLTICEIAAVLGSMAFGSLASRIGAQGSAVIALTSYGHPRPRVPLHGRSVVSVVGHRSDGVDQHSQCGLHRPSHLVFPRSRPVERLGCRFRRSRCGQQCRIRRGNRPGKPRGVFRIRPVAECPIARARLPRRASELHRRGDPRGTPSFEFVERDRSVDPQLQAVLVDDPTALDTAQADGLRIVGICLSVTFGAAALVTVPGLHRRAREAT